MPVKDLTGITAKDAQMLSVVKPLQEFGKLDKCLSRYGTRFEFNNEKQVIFSSNVNSEDTFVILEGVISLRREENVLIGITQAPYIMGLADGLMKNDIPYKLISEGTSPLIKYLRNGRRVKPTVKSITPITLNHFLYTAKSALIFTLSSSAIGLYIL